MVNTKSRHAQRSCFLMIYDPDCSVEWLCGPFRVMFDEERERERALAKLCVSKCSKMDLTNHKTAYFALQNLPQAHKDSLKRMGYGVMNVLPLQNTAQLLDREVQPSEWQ